MEWLSQIIVSAALQRDDLFRFLTSGAQHQNTDPRMSPQLLDYLKPRQLRQSHVQNHKVVNSGESGLKTGLTVVRNLYCHSFAHQVLLQ
jgi:hypothetical protein